MFSHKYNCLLTVDEKDVDHFAPMIDMQYVIERALRQCVKLASSFSPKMKKYKQALTFDKEDVDHFAPVINMTYAIERVLRQCVKLASSLSPKMKKYKQV